MMSTEMTSGRVSSTRTQMLEWYDSGSELDSELTSLVIRRILSVSEANE
jgi:hypothetical protein